MADAAAEADEDLTRQASLAEYQSLPDPIREVADARMAVLSAWSDFQAGYDLPIGKLRAQFRTLLSRRAVDLDERVYKLAIRHRRRTISGKTLRSWEERLKRRGPVGLAPADGKRSRRTYQTAIDSDPEMRALVLGMLAAHGAHLSASNVWERLRVDFPDTTPTVRTIQRFIDRWRQEKGQVATYLESPEKWRSGNLVAFGRMDDGVERPNQVWELDSTLGDVELLDRDAEGNVRPTRFAQLSVVDVYTRRSMFLVCRTSRAAAIAVLLRRAMLAWGIPEILRMDNGKDYASKHIDMLTATLEIRVDRCTPFSPWEKPFVERKYRTLSGKMQLLPGYTGASVADRKALRSREEARVRAGQPPIDLGSVGIGPIEFQAWLDEWAENQDARTPHKGIGCTPMERLQRYTGRIRRILDERALDCLMEPLPRNAGRRTIGKSGIQIGRNTWAIAPELAAYEGEEVLCFYDPYDTRRICVYGGTEMRFICWAVVPENAAERRQIAVRARKIQRLHIQEEMRELRRASADVSDSWMKIAVNRSMEAASLQVMPKASDEYTTPALEEASRAADAREAMDRVRELPRENPPEVEEKIRELRALDERDPFQRPQYWRDDHEHYLWCFKCVQARREDVMLVKDWQFINEYEDRYAMPEEDRLLALHNAVNG